MRERPILFSAPMVRAILDGGKTQTRRTISGLKATARRTFREDEPPVGFGPLSRPRTALEGHTYRAEIASGGAVSVETDGEWLGAKPGEFDFVCPYVVGRTYLDRNPDRWRIEVAAGSRLWVREEHFRFGHWEPVAGAKTRKGGRQKWMFVADSDETRFTAPDGVEVRRGRHHRDPATPAWHKRLARFMPRCLSRITLEVTSVHVERLHDITKEDAIAEGAHAVDGPLGAYGDGPRWSMDRPHPVEVLGRDEGWKRCLGTPQMAFANLWNRINGLDAWYSNPWVWVVSFRKLEVARG